MSESAQATRDERNKQINELVEQMLLAAEHAQAVEPRAPLYVLGALAVLLAGRKVEDYRGQEHMRLLTETGTAMINVARTIFDTPEAFPPGRALALGLFKPRPFDVTVAELYSLADAQADSEVKQKLLCCAKEMFWTGDVAALLSQQLGELQGIMEKAVPWEETEGWIARHVDHGPYTTEEIQARQGVRMTCYTCPCGDTHIQTAARTDK